MPDTEQDLWTESREGGVVVATYRNPPVNYFTQAAMISLGKRVAKWRDPGIRAVILTGIDTAFVTHYSVEELAVLAGKPDLVRQQGARLGGSFHDLLRSLNQLPVPVISAINGDAMGGGFELALGCDIRIAATGDHRIGLPEATLGLLPGGSGTQRLIRLLGAGRAINILLRGKVFTPDAALANGLVHEITADPLGRAKTIADEFSGLSRVALAEIKRAVYLGADAPTSVGLEIEAEGFAQTLLSAESRTIMRDYVAQPIEKRRAWLTRHRALIGDAE